MATLEAVLKTAIQVEFQLEDRELATEALPSSDNRKEILLFESAEGGAGVLQRLVDEPSVIKRIARRAIELIHFDPDSGEDQKHAVGSSELCEAACYACLLSYYNQREHRLLDRHVLPDILFSWIKADVQASPSIRPREDHLTRLLKVCDSELERRWLTEVDSLGLQLPNDAQRLIESCHVRPDFEYQKKKTVIFIDGPHHDEEQQKEKDHDQEDDLEDVGYLVIRFRYDQEWKPIFSKFPDVFGKFSVRTSERVYPTPEPETDDDEEGPFDLEDYEPAWHPLLLKLKNEYDVKIEHGEEIMSEGRVVDLELAIFTKGRHVVHLLDSQRLTAKNIESVLKDRNIRSFSTWPEDPHILGQILHALNIKT